MYGELHARTRSLRTQPPVDCSARSRSRGGAETTLYGNHFVWEAAFRKKDVVLLTRLATSARERGPGPCGALPRAGCGGAGGGVRPGRGGGRWHQAPDHGAELWAVRKGVCCVEKQGAGRGGTGCCRAM